MIYCYYILSALLIFMSYKSFHGGLRYLGFFKSELAKLEIFYLPFATIVAPCKGLEDGLEQNLKALLEQDYPNFEVIFVVDANTDPATASINSIIAERAKLVIAPRTTESS